MADYIYLLQNRLSLPQQAALHSIREIARLYSLTVFLTGGAVRDLTSGSPVRDLDVAVQGNALKLRKELEAASAVLMGELASSQSLFARFPGGVRVEIGSTLSATYPKSGKPIFQAATILDDLRRRDFTANAMALSLNDGSYGLLMDPLNGVADIENRQLRLVSNYGFIEDPSRMIRAVRFSARLGWTMDEKTQARYETGKEEKYISSLSGSLRGYETEEIFHEEDPLRVLRQLEEEGWMKYLFPAMTVAKANVGELEKLREVQTQLQVSGIHPDAASANFPLLTAKLTPSEVADLKKSFVRQGFVAEIEHLETDAKEFAAQLTGKGAALPSQAWKAIQAAKPEAVLWLAYSSKSPAVQAKLKSFYTEWPKARQKVPFALMQEMRIVPELEAFNEIVEKVFFEMMDGKLTTPEEQKSFLETYSPPAPPPPVHLRRSRAGKKEGKGSKSKKKLSVMPDEEDDALDLDAEQGTSRPDDENEDMEQASSTMDSEPGSDLDEPESKPEQDFQEEPAAAAVPESVKSVSKRTRAKTASSNPDTLLADAIVPTVNQPDDLVSLESHEDKPDRANKAAVKAQTASTKPAPAVSKIVEEVSTPKPGKKPTPKTAALAELPARNNADLPHLPTKVPKVKKSAEKKESTPLKAVPLLKEIVGKVSKIKAAPQKASSSNTKATKKTR